MEKGNENYTCSVKQYSLWLAWEKIPVRLYCLLKI